MRPFSSSILAVLLAALASTAPAGAQEPESAQAAGRPNVFFDCQGMNCNSTYYRTEIEWVDWVRDRQDSDVHLIMTSQATGAGGRQYQLDFIGEGEHEDFIDQLTYSTLPTDTDREELDGITHAIAVGLARFAAEAGFRDVVQLQGLEPPGGLDPAAGVVSPEQVDDPWNLWVFRINGSMNVDGEETRETTRVNGSLSASRVTPTWKLDFDGNVNYNHRKIELTDEPDFIDTRTDWGLTQLVVYSVAEHWSIGFNSEARKMVSVNQDFRFELTPAVEYSFFPYEEATRRALTAFYEIGPSYRNYADTTIYGEIEETRFEQSLELEFSQRQPWGDASISLNGSHFLHDLDLYNVTLRGDVDVRIFRGFSINAQGNVGWVQDQIYLSAREADTAEELLNLRRRAQDFNYGFEVGFNFQFGSIYNNVVNNRFGGGGGFGRFGGFGR